jgi:hypothetical protein
MGLTQRGSVLVGVIGITTMLSVAAAGLMLVAANSRTEEDMAFKRAKCYYDAESGLMLGLGWLRKQGRDFIANEQPWGGVDSLVFNLPQPLENGSSVQIVIKDLAGAAASPNPTKTVLSMAVIGSETIRFAWDVGVEPTADPVKPRLILKKWRYQ